VNGRKRQKRADTDRTASTTTMSCTFSRTSPFLEDSDSDGANDGVEVGQEPIRIAPRAGSGGYVRPVYVGGAAERAFDAPGAAAGPAGTAKRRLASCFSNFRRIHPKDARKITAKGARTSEDSCAYFLVKMAGRPRSRRQSKRR